MVQTVRGAGYRFSAAVLIARLNWRSARALRAAPIPPGSKTLGQLALVLAAAAVVLPALLLLATVPGRCVTFAALGVVAWHYWKLHGVLRRLTARQRLAPPQGVGVWNELDRLLHRSQADMRARKRRLLDMLRAYRAAADGAARRGRGGRTQQPARAVVQQRRDLLLGLRYPRDINAPLGQRLQPMALAHWLAGRPQRRTADGRRLAGRSRLAPEPAPDPVFAKNCGCWSRATSAS